MTHSSDAIGEAARLWAIRLNDPAFAEWDAFTDWLAEDPAHATAYDTAVQVDSDMAGLFSTPSAPTLIPANDPAPRRRWLGVAGGGAIAAAGVAALTFTLWNAGSQPYAVETANGARRTVQLADGSSIEMNGGTRIVLDADEPRLATLERGEALFHVRHDESDPFVVKAGRARLLDAGTVFNVVRDRGTTRVAVSEGAVIYNPSTDAVRLNPGDALIAPDTGKSTRLPRVALDSVGGWRSGQLAYDDAPLDQIAADLSRNLGRPVGTAPGTAEIRFTGTIALSGDPARSIARVAPLLGVSAVPSGAGWTLTPLDREHP